MADIYMPDMTSYPLSQAHVKDLDSYKLLYRKSLHDPNIFWDDVAQRLSWFRKWKQVSNYDFVTGDISWFTGGLINACYNCVDRHVEAGHGDQTAILWEGNDTKENSSLTFTELLLQVQKFSNVLKRLGITKGDRVCIYLQMIPELAIAMLACARIGAVHSIVFGAFSSESLRDRINDAECKLLITQDTAVRGPKNDIPMKANADQAVSQCPTIKHKVVVRRTGNRIEFDSKRDVWWHEEMAKASPTCPPERMEAEDPLFILYTSGSTGKPKGVLHTTGGYLLYAAYTHELVFDYHPGDIFWCTADIGWITGHSYIIYGPLANRATTVMFEGVPSYPDFGRLWEIIEKYRVNIFYTAPTVLRALMREGDQWVDPHDRSSLRLLATVGEPIKEPEWKWYYHSVGQGRCPIIDTWWQTETGGILISPLPAVTPLKPGSATLPFFGVEPVLLDSEGNELTESPATGYLCIKQPWPGIMRTVYGDHDRFRQTYFKMFPGYYLTGDGCTRDADGYYWITGRIDDVLNISGHRIGTAEVEGAIGQHHAVAEAAVVGFPHDVKGQGIYAYVTLMAGLEPSEITENEIREEVRKHIGPHASPDLIQFASALPKTRSGKIMRRILRKIAEGDTSDAALGDLSTLSEPEVVSDLIAHRV